MSVNDAWQGRRYKTKNYIQYTKTLLTILPNIKVPVGKIEVHFVFAISCNSDIDNPLKLIIDVFGRKYNFNDKNIMKLIVEKINIKKGKEYFEFKIIPYIWKEKGI